MSDEDDFMMSADEDDFDFEYDDDDDADNQNASNMDTDGEPTTEFDAENKYYNAKAYKDEDPRESLKQFEDLYVNDSDPDWRFKALKQSVKVLFMLGDGPQLVNKLETLLDQSRAVTKSYAEKSLNNLIEYFTVSSNTQLTETALNAMSRGLKEINERLWVKANLKLANMYLGDASTNKQRYSDAKELLHTLELSLVFSDTTSSSSLQLEVLALELELCLAANDMDTLKQVYNKVRAVSTAVSHPRIMGTIRACGGRLYVAELRWEEAAEAFFEAFQNFDEAGMPERLSALQYYVLTGMLANTGINPFESQETKPYVDHPAISPMVQLVSAFESRNLDAFNGCLAKNEQLFKQEPLMIQSVAAIRKSLLGHSIIELVASYRSISLNYLSTLLTVDESTVLESTTQLILDKKLTHARLDATRGYLYMNHASAEKPLVEHEPVDSMRSIVLPKRYMASRQEVKLRDRSGSRKKSMLGSSDRFTTLSTWLDATSELHRAVAH